MAKKLLLADDSLTIQKVVGIVFANLDYQLLVADNGDAALDLARKEFPDLIIADVGMPGKDGIALCREIKGDADLAATPVLLLPGAFENFDEGKAEDAGASGWITKPFESQALIDKVEECLAAAPVKPLAPAAEPAPAEEPAPLAVDDLEPVIDEEPEPETVSTFEPEPLAEEESEPTADFEFSTDPEPVSFAAPESEVPVGEESAADSDDIWDAVTFEEEDLQADGAELGVVEPAPVAPAAEPIQFEDPAPEREEASTVIAEEPEEEILGLADEPEEEEEILELADEPEEEEEVLELTDEPEEEEDILELADEPEEEEEILELAEDDILELDDDAIIEEVTDEEPETYDFEAESPEEPISVVEPVPAPVDFSAPQTLTETESEVAVAPADIEPLEEVAELTPEPMPAVEPVTSSAAVEQAEEQLRGLDESELEQVVRKVAGSMLEKLAKEMLEQVVWEVVPDLAESMIKEEIRKIKEGAA